jgi:hypothetical protein
VAYGKPGADRKHVRGTTVLLCEERLEYVLRWHRRIDLMSQRDFGPMVDDIAHVAHYQLEGIERCSGRPDEGIEWIMAYHKSAGPMTTLSLDRASSCRVSFR